MIKKILIWDNLITYIKDRWLEKQYKKAKTYVLAWFFNKADFKLREPKKDKIYYFRINKQFRAYWTIEENILKIHHIDNHQK